MVEERLNTTPEDTQARVITARAMRKGRKKVENTAQNLGRLAVEYVPLNSVTPNDYNPNRQSDHDFELLLRSMEDDGFTQPIIVTREESVIVDGEHRWRAAAALGFDEIPVVRVDMSPEQAKVATIRHNRARGSHDIDLEAAVLQDLEALGAMEWAQDALMMTDAEVERLLDDVAAPDAMADEEFSEAWVPESMTDADKEELRSGVGSVHHETRDGALQVGGTIEAIEAQRKREKLLEKAKSAQDRETVQKENRIFRVNLIFSNEQADIVKPVLGERPAEAMLELCRAELDRRQG